MTARNKSENIAGEIALGDDALRAAEALEQLGLFNDAISRAYYAAFHYARALLLTEGREPKTHRGIVALLGERFEGPDGLGSEAISAFARLQTFRGVADYDARDRLTAERAAAELASARAFVTQALKLLKLGAWIEPS